MEYRRLGHSGLLVSEFSFGSWLTFGADLDLDHIKECLRLAFSLGVNFFDNAEVYRNGASELLMGEALRDFKREELVISTKLFWGGKGPNREGLSRKHLLEGLHHSLRRLQLDYVDLLFCHRPAPNTPIAETVRAMDHIIRSGKALYWGTSEWSAAEIEEAHKVAERLGVIPPLMEQPQYNMLRRTRVEKEYAPLYEKYGMGTTTWSPLAAGILTGKYQKGIPKGSRMDKEKWLQEHLNDEVHQLVKGLEPIAKELSCTLAQLSIAWCLLNPRVSSVITGASHAAQIQENIAAIAVKKKITEDVLKKIQQIIP